MDTMTYGQLPTRDAFDAAFERECPNGYRISLGSSDSRAVDGFKLGDGKWTCDQLWDAITEIVNDTGDEVTVSEDEEYEDVYQLFNTETEAMTEIGPDESELIDTAQLFSESVIENITRAKECLNFAAAYGEVGHDYTRKDAAMDLVSCIMDTLGFEWV